MSSTSALERLEQRITLTAAPLSPGGSSVQRDVSLDSVPYQATVAVWTQESGDGQLDIHARRIGRDGLPTDEVDLIIASSPLPEKSPAVAVAANGDFVVAFERHDAAEVDSDSDIYFQRMNASGQLVGSPVKVNTYDSGEDQVHAAIAMDADGNFVVVWENRGGVVSDAGHNLQYRRFSADGSPLDLEEQLVGLGFEPDVAMNETGDFVVVYHDVTTIDDGSGPRDDSEVRFEWFTSDGDNTNSGTVYEDASKNQSSAVVAMDRVGNFVVAFEHEFNSLDSDIYAQRFLAGGTKNGVRLSVAAESVAEVNPSIDMADFGFVIGYGQAISQESAEAWVRRYDVAGNLQSVDRFGNAGDAVLSGDVALVDHQRVAVVAERDLSSSNQIWFQFLGQSAGRHAGSNVGGFFAESGQIWAGFENATSTGFENVLVDSWSAEATWLNILSGDFTGPGTNGVVGRTSSGSWWLSDGSSTSLWGAWAPLNWVDIQVGDVDGDGRDDILGRWPETGQWWLARSTGTGFVNELWATWSAAVDWRDVQLADVNGDGRQDIVGRTENGQWWAGISNGSSFDSALWGAWAPEAGWEDVSFGDVDGDGREDIAGRTASGSLWVARSTGSGFVNEFWGAFSPTAGWRDVTLADVNGDGRDDYVGRTAEGQFWVGISTGNQFVNQNFGYFGGIEWSDRVDVLWGDFNRDGRREPLFRHPDDGRFLAGLSDGSTFNVTQWGVWSAAVDWRFLQVF